jgi:type I restriction enzyme, S subunit
VNNKEGWKVATIEECCEILDSKRIPVNAEERESRIGEIPYYGANGLQGYIDDYIFKEDLILIAEDGGCFDEFAIRAIAYKISGKSWVNNHAHVLKAKQYYSQNFIFYSLEHKDIQSFIVGGTRAKLNQTALRSIQLSLPDKIEEQTQIAAILSTIDLAITQTEAIIAKQQRIKTGLMQDLLTKGIDENGNIRSEATHEFKDSAIGRIPVEWKVENLNDLILEITSGSRGWAKFYSEEGALFLRIGNLTRNNINLELDELKFVKPPKTAEGKRSSVQLGDILISITADLGIIAAIPDNLGEAYVNQHIALIRVDELRINPRFLAHFLAGDKGQDQFEKFNESGAKAGLNLPTVGRLNIPLTNLPEQDKICSYLDSMDEYIAKLLIDVQKLHREKTGLMQDLLTGKVRVTPLLEQEPASR